MMTRAPPTAKAKTSAKMLLGERGSKVESACSSDAVIVCVIRIVLHTTLRIDYHDNIPKSVRTLRFSVGTKSQTATSTSIYEYARK